MIITVCRKPFSGSVNDCVVNHQCGGINIDRTRIKFETDGARKTTKRNKREDDRLWAEGQSGMKNENSLFADADPRGRFPSNVILQTETATTLDEQSLKGGMHSAGHAKPHDTNRSNGAVVPFGGGDLLTNGGRYGHSGGASRFFKVVK